MAEFLIGLGSNRGDSHAELVMARAWLHLCGKVLASSQLYITEPVGPGTSDYLNAALLLHTPLSPFALLRYAKRYERDRGRLQPYQRWTDRPIDIDLLDMGKSLHTAELTLPHPEISQRKFVLAPILDIVPDWKEPVSGQTGKSLYAKAPEIRITITANRW
jgi:2-amino-4-hydroxy-6-hydroxymethyldihydropteridine diphosphokinase